MRHPPPVAVQSSRSRRVVGLAVLASTGCLAALPARAANAPDPISVQSLPAAGGTQIEARESDVSYGFRISNNGSSALSVTLAVRPTTRTGARLCAAPACTLGWKIDGQPATPGREQSISIAAYASKELTYSGRAENLGVYYSEAIVDPSASGGADPDPVPVSIKVTRVLPSLGEKAIVVDPPGRRVLWSTAGKAIGFTIHNSGDDAVTLGDGLRARLQREEDDGDFVDIGQKPTVTCENGPVPERGDLACTIDDPEITAPGRYRAEVRLVKNVVADAAHVDFTIRLPWYIAALVMLFGSILGAWLAGYQNNGRRRALQGADILDLQEKLAVIAGSLTGQNPDSNRLIADLKGELREATDDLRTNPAADYAGSLATWGERFRLSHRFASLEAAFRDGRNQVPLQQAYDAALAAVEQDPPPPDSEARLDALKSALRSNLVKARVAGNSAADPSEFFFSWRPAATSTDLLGTVRWLDRSVLALSIVIATAIAVATLWVPNPTWGAFSDVLVAFFTGLGMALAGALSIGQLVGGYRLGQVGAK